MIHTAEAIAGAKYQCIPFRQNWGVAAKRLNSQGMEEILEQDEFPGCSYNFGIVENEPSIKECIKFGKVGNADTRIMDAQEFICKVVEILKVKPDFLLCNRPDCECCINRKKFMHII
jgi:aminoglycoside N3'-acetyltransferase